MTISEIEQAMYKQGYTVETLSEKLGIPAEIMKKVFALGPSCEEFDAMIALNCFFDIESTGYSYEIRESGVCEPAVKYGETSSSAHSEFFAPKRSDNKWRSYTVEDYYRLPHGCYYELIKGVFYRKCASPSAAHQRLAGKLFHQLETYVEQKRGGCVPFFAPLDVDILRDDKALVLPDVFVVCDRDKIKADHIDGAPDFVAEILSRSTSRCDQTIKRELYREAGVREYWIVDPFDKTVRIYFFEKDAEQPAIYSLEEKIPVHIFDGLCTVVLCDTSVV